MERKLPAEHSFRSKLKLFQQVLDQNKTDKNKIYSLHEPEVCCISKGKAHKKYEFGNKVSLAVTQGTNVAIEPIIGHLKTDFRLSRNFYKSKVGDNINVLLAASAFNLKRMMNRWKSSFCVYFLKFIESYKIHLKTNFA